jgi:hypothetical protein
MTLDHSTHLARSVIRSTNFDHRNSSLLVLVGLFSNAYWTVSLFVRKKAAALYYFPVLLADG